MHLFYLSIDSQAANDLFNKKLLENERDELSQYLPNTSNQSEKKLKCQNCQSKDVNQESPMLDPSLILDPHFEDQEYVRKGMFFRTVFRRVAAK